MIKDFDTFIRESRLGRILDHSFSDKLRSEDKVPVPDLVDLGLPSGTLWANKNLFSFDISDPGRLFQFARVDGYVYGDENHGFKNFAEYESESGAAYEQNDGTRELYDVDDCATVILGKDWKLPTEDQYRELLDNTTNEGMEIKGMKGRLFTSKINGETLFLPAGGNYYCKGDNFIFKNSSGNYWTRTPGKITQTASNGVSFNFEVHNPNASACQINRNYRYEGYSVRPVSAHKKNTLKESRLGRIFNASFGGDQRKEDKIDVEDVLYYFDSSKFTTPKITIKNENGRQVVYVDGSYAFDPRKMTNMEYFPFVFGTVSGVFSCELCDIVSLYGAPTEVDGEFNCQSCINLESLEYAPKRVGRSFVCTGCKKIKSFKFFPELIGGSVFCGKCGVDTLEGVPETINGHFRCKWSELKSTKGAPKIVKGSFDLGCNQNLTSLESIPEEIWEDLDCRDCGVETPEEEIRKRSKILGRVLLGRSTTN